MAPLFSSLSDKHSKLAVFLKVDTDKLKEVAQEAGVKALPSFAFYHDARLLDMQQGGDPVTLEAKISALAAKHNTNAFRGAGHSMALQQRHPQPSLLQADCSAQCLAELAPTPPLQPPPLPLLHPAVAIHGQTPTLDWPRKPRETEPQLHPPLLPLLQPNPPQPQPPSLQLRLPPLLLPHPQLPSLLRQSSLPLHPSRLLQLQPPRRSRPLLLLPLLQPPPPLLPLLPPLMLAAPVVQAASTPGQPRKSRAQPLQFPLPLRSSLRPQPPRVPLPLRPPLPPPPLLRLLTLPRLRQLPLLHQPLPLLLLPSHLLRRWPTILRW